MGATETSTAKINENWKENEGQINQIISFHRHLEGITKCAVSITGCNLGAMKKTSTGKEIYYKKEKFTCILPVSSSFTYCSHIH